MTNSGGGQIFLLFFSTFLAFSVASNPAISGDRCGVTRSSISGDILLAPLAQGIDAFIDYLDEQPIPKVEAGFILVDDGGHKIFAIEPGARTLQALGLCGVIAFSEVSANGSWDALSDEAKREIFALHVGDRPRGSGGDAVDYYTDLVQSAFLLYGNTFSKLGPIYSEARQMPLDDFGCGLGCNPSNWAVSEDDLRARWNVTALDVARSGRFFNYDGQVALGGHRFLSDFVFIFPNIDAANEISNLPPEFERGFRLLWRMYRNSSPTREVYEKNTPISDLAASLRRFDRRK